MDSEFKAKIESMGVRVIETPQEEVRDKLQRWRDYHEGTSLSSPGPAYSATDKVADALYRAREPIKSINSVDEPELDLRISNEGISAAIQRAEAGEGYIFP